jgi:hypothetical protein
MNSMAKHVYRKRFDDRFSAEETAKGFLLFGNIDQRGSSEVDVREEGGAFWVYVALHGEVLSDPAEMLQATGYEQVV